MKRRSNQRLIRTRYVLIIMIMMILVATIIYRLVNTTVVHSDDWNKAAMEKLNKYDTIMPVRGNILAADGSILATNLRKYTVRIDYRATRFDSAMLCDTIKQLADSMALAFPAKTARQWKETLLKPLTLPKKKRPTGFKVVENISYLDYERLRSFPFFSLRNPNRNGVVKEVRMRRINPYGQMALRSIGRVSMGVKNGNRTKEIHGYSGLEMALDSMLFGRVGFSKKVPLTHGIYNWTDRAPVNGNTIQTTIDIKMQDIVENELNAMLQECQARWGVAVLMEVATGDIKAISNLQFDEKNPANGYIEGMNRAVLGFEPGSVMKAVSMLIALENGITTPGQIISTPSPYPYAGGRAIRDCSPVASMAANEVLERSSNVGMTRIITSKYGSNPGDFYTALKRIGFLEKFNVGIGGERAPRIDSLSRKDQVALSRQCYGYATEIPPLHTLALYNAIANGGRFVRPRLVQRIKGADFDSIVPVTYVRDRICSEANARVLRDMLVRVTEGSHGTARCLRNDLVSIAGKTGTALTIENGVYNEGKKRLAFCGFFPAEKPRYSCMVLISEPRNGAGAARTSGMVLKNVALRLYSRGMLGNDERFDTRKVSESSAVLYASRRPDETLAALGAQPSVKRQSQPRKSGNGVPAVVGYGLRDALAVLEGAGYNVAVNGTGCVVAQTPSAGAAIRPGSTVHLTLRH